MLHVWCNFVISGNERDQPEICSVFKQVPINCLPGDTQGRENVEVHVYT